MKSNKINPEVANEGLSVVVDTNLLLLFIIGSLSDGKYIKASKRINNFCQNDYDIVKGVIFRHKTVIITPYIATEVSNLIDLKDEARLDAYDLAQNLFTNIFQEEVSSLKEDIDDIIFKKYGITDSSIVKLSKKYNIFTNDTRLLPALYESCPENIITYEMAKTSHMNSLFERKDKESSHRIRKKIRRNQKGMNRTPP